MKKILILVTNHATLGDTDEANGTYAAELTHPVAVFNKANFSYDVVSVKGGEAPLYGEDDFDDQAHKSVMLDADFQKKIGSTMKASEITIEDYDAVFYPGGFGLLSDLANDRDVAKLTSKLYENGGVVGAVCHGPAGLLPVKLANGDNIMSAKKTTCFTKSEEVAGETIDKIPFVLEDNVTEISASFSCADIWQEHVVIDGNLITGQNPASAHGVGQAMVDALS